MEPVDLALIQSAIDIMDMHIEKKEKIYIHCKAGRGRSAIIATFYFVKRKGLSLEQALSIIKEKRPQIVLQPFQYSSLQRDLGE